VKVKRIARRILLFAIGVVLITTTAACAAPTPEVVQELVEVEVTRMVAGTPEIVVVTATPGPEPTPVPEEGPKVVKVGLVMALTGDSAMWGWSNYAAAKLRAEEINAAQDEYEIQIIAEDDASNCDQSVSGALKLITEDKVDVLEGTVNSSCTLLIVPVTAEYKVPHLTTSVGTAITRQGSNYIFRIQTPIEWSTEQLVEYVVEDMGLTKIAVLYSNDEYGKSGAEGVKAALERRGLEPAAYETYVTTDKDFTGQLSIVQQAGADAVCHIGSIVAGALTVRQMRDLGMDQQFLAPVGYGYAEFPELAGDAANGTVFVEPFYPLLDDPNVKPFREAFVREYQREANTNAAMTYDSIGMIYEAVSQAGRVDREVIREYLAGLTPEDPYTGVMGDIYFDEKGDPLVSMVKLMWQDAEAVFLKR